MAEEKKQSAKEEKELLAREEIKTMKKDTSRLRETEAGQEMERIAKLRTEQEIQREKERQIKAQEMAAARQKAETEAQKRVEEVGKLRDEREKKEEIITKETARKEEGRAAGFKDLLKDTQNREEEQRKRFLARVEAQAEGKEAPAAPSPLPPPIKPPLKPPEKPTEPKPSLIPKPSFKKPPSNKRIWLKVILTLLTLAILGAIASFWYWYLVVREKTTTPEPEEIVEELIIPPALIATEDSWTIEFPSLSQVLQEDLGEGQFTRLVIKDEFENKAWGLREFFEVFGVETPATFYDKINNDFTLFIYSSQGINRLGFVAEVTEFDLISLLADWEATTMEQDIEDLAVFLGKTGPAGTAAFKEATYKGTAFHYLSLQPENFGLCWAMTDNYFIFTFSGESIIKTMDKINE